MNEESMQVLVDSLNDFEKRLSKLEKHAQEHRHMVADAGGFTFEAYTKPPLGPSPAQRELQEAQHVLRQNPEYRTAIQQYADWFITRKGNRDGLEAACFRGGPVNRRGLSTESESRLIAMDVANELAERNKRLASLVDQALPTLARSLGPDDLGLKALKQAVALAKGDTK